MKKRFVNVFYDGTMYWIHYDDVYSNPIYIKSGEVCFDKMEYKRGELVRTCIELDGYEMPEVVIVKDKENHFAIFSMYSFHGDMAMSHYGAVYLSKNGFVYKSIKELRVWNKIEEFQTDYNRFFLTENKKGHWGVFRLQYAHNWYIDPAVSLKAIGSYHPDYCADFDDLKSFLKRKQIVNLIDEPENQEYRITDLTIAEEFNNCGDFGFNLQEIKDNRVKQRTTEGMSMTPDNIQELSPNEVFVFGSNLQGHHHGGAAKLAYENFGAVWGLGVGLAGQSYAIPTMHGGVDAIKPYVDQFIEMAKVMKDKKFYVTKIGCGIAGFKIEEMAPLFKGALELENVALPREFVMELKR